MTHLRYNAQGDPTITVDPSGNKVTSAYNIDNRPLSVTYPATGQTGTGNAEQTYTYQYQVNSTAQYGRLSALTSYDESGTQVAQVTATYGKEGEKLSMAGSTEPVSYSYDGIYRLTSLTDGAGHATDYYYNGAGYLDTVTLPGYSGPTPAYNTTTKAWDNVTGADSLRYASYDAIGDLLTRVDGNGTTTTYTYSDPDSLLTNVHYTLPSSPPSTLTSLADTSFTYDSYGRRSTMTDATGSFSYAYDDDDNLTGAQTSYTALQSATHPSTTLTYSYWPGGGESALSYGYYTLASPGTPAGTFNYTYDGDGRLSSVLNPFNETSSWTYQSNGWLGSQTLSNASGSTVASTSYTDNALGLPTELKTVNGSGTTLSDFGGSGTGAMYYDGVGDRTSMPVNVPSASTYSGTTNYTYDGISGTGTRGQVTQESSTRLGSYTDAFAYDGGSYSAGTGIGNPTTMRGGSVSFNADNQIASNTYDGNGNPTAYTGNTLSYDPENRLTAFNSAETNAYDGDDHRASTTTSAGTSYSFYDGGTPILTEDNTGTVTNVLTVGLNGLVSTHGSSTGFYTWDPQGNLCQKLDSTGAVVETRAFDAFGNVAKTDSDTDPYAGFGGQWGYRLDSVTSLYQLGHRYYDPSTGRFVTRDPIGYAGGLNLYAYTRNNPVNGIDPNGTSWRGFGRTFGTGPVTMIFDSDTVTCGLQTGLAATASAASGGLYDGGKYKNNAGFGTSQGLATTGVIAAEMAVGVGEARVATEGAELAETPEADGGLGEALTNQKNILKNKQSGDAWRDEIADGLKPLESQGFKVEKEVSVNTPIGRRVLDVQVKDSDDNAVLAIEAKVGSSRYHQLQQAKDGWIERNLNYPVVLTRKP